MIDLKNRSASRFESGPVGLDNALKCFVGSAITFDWMVLANNHDMKDMEFRSTLTIPFRLDHVRPVGLHREL